jgi:hypothetical protein
MATPVIISMLVGLLAGGAFMAIWAANRIEEEAARQFDRGFERGRWLTDISVAQAIEDQDRTRRVGLLVASARPPTRPPGQEPRPWWRRLGSRRFDASTSATCSAAPAAADDGPSPLVSESARRPGSAPCG